LELIYFKILEQFSHLSFKICEFSFSNQILLGLFDVLYVISGLYLSCLNYLTYFCFNVKLILL